MFNNQQGFSLIGVVTATAIVGILILSVTKVMTSLVQAKKMAEGNSDEITLVSHVRLLLNEEKSCRVSIAGNGPQRAPANPVIFRKSDVDEEGEGLDIELWLSNQNGEQRTTKQFSGTDAAMKTFGQLNVKSIKILFNNGTGSDYSQAAEHTDVAEVKISIGKKQSNGIEWEKVLSFPVGVALTTDASGSTTFLSCSAEASGGGIPGFGAPTRPGGGGSGSGGTGNISKLFFH